VPNFAKGACGVGLVAAAALSPAPNALSDAELKKKPFWYRETVDRLEKALTRLSLYSYIDDAERLNDAIDILKRSENVNNCEITWRLGRALTERAELFSARAFEDRTEYYVKAIDYFRKALTIEPAKGCAGLHKWFAITLKRFTVISYTHPYLKNATKEITQHLERAVQLDPKDAIAVHLLGVHYLDMKQYDKALQQFLAAEELKKDYYPSNMYYLGLAYHKLGRKEEAVKALEKTFFLVSHNKFDRKAKSCARAVLFSSYKMKNFRPYPKY